MQDNIITWNLANWVSVVIMALIGFLALGTLVSFVKGKQGAANVSSGNPVYGVAQQ